MRGESVLILSVLWLSGVHAGDGRCQSYSFTLDSARLDPCSSFKVEGMGCFQSSLQRDLIVESYKWILYERYQQIFREARVSNVYGGKCSTLYGRTCPGEVNSIASCEPLCEWFQNVVIHETIDTSCKCNTECESRASSATPLMHSKGGAVTETYSVTNLLIRIRVAVPTDLSPSPKSVMDFQETMGKMAGLNQSLVQLSQGEFAQTGTCQYLQVEGHVMQAYNGLWTAGDPWDGMPHYIAARGSAGCITSAHKLHPIHDECVKDT